MKDTFKLNYEWLRPEMVAQIQQEIAQKRENCASPSQQQLLRMANELVGLLYRALIRSPRAKQLDKEAEFLIRCSDSLANTCDHIRERLANNHGYFTEGEYLVLLEYWRKIDTIEGHTLINSGL